MFDRRWWGFYGKENSEIGFEQSRDILSNYSFNILIKGVFASGIHEAREILSLAAQLTLVILMLMEQTLSVHLVNLRGQVLDQESVLDVDQKSWDWFWSLFPFS